MAARKAVGPKITVGKVPADAETPVQAGADAPVESVTESWIVYADDEGKVQRITVDQYHKEGRG
jgi:hypothetical protein